MSILKDFYEENNEKMNELIAENTKLKRLIQLYEKNCKIVADASFKMQEMIINLKGMNESLQFELSIERWKNERLTKAD